MKYEITNEQLEQVINTFTDAVPTTVNIGTTFTVLNQLLSLINIKKSWKLAKLSTVSLIDESLIKNVSIILVDQKTDLIRLSWQQKVLEIFKNLKEA